MSGKSRKRKGRFQPQSKRKKGRRSHPVVLSQPEAAPPAEEATPPVEEKVTAVAEAAAAPPAPTIVKNPEVVAELRRIGILAGTMLTALIILALVLS